jgi:hypothetical protein
MCILEESKHNSSQQGGTSMTSIADKTVKIQTTSASNITTPAWFGEVVVISSSLQKHKVLTKMNEQVRFARKRFGRYEIIDFFAVLFGDAISGERTLEEFYQRLQPFAVPFMALFERDRLPSRSALSRFLAALTEAPVEALRTLFLDDLLARPLTPDKQTGGLVDRAGNTWTVFDVDGTREAARQRALPQADDLPPAFRRLDEVCAPGNPRRKRGETVRTRTTVSQAHSYQWLGNFGNRGNGRSREELRQGLAAISRSLAAHQRAASRTLIRLDGQYGNGAVLSDLAGFAFVTRGKDDRLLDHPLGRGAFALALRSGAAATRKSKGAQPLRRSSDPDRARWQALSRCRGHASGRQKEESDWRHTKRRGLRAVLHEFAPTRLHGLRCGRVVSASWLL